MDYGIAVLSIYTRPAAFIAFPESQYTIAGNRSWTNLEHFSTNLCWTVGHDNTGPLKSSNLIYCSACNPKSQ